MRSILRVLEEWLKNIKGGGYFIYKVVIGFGKNYCNIRYVFCDRYNNIVLVDIDLEIFILKVF